MPTDPFPTKFLAHHQEPVIGAIYLASPFEHPNPRVRDARAEAAIAISVELINQGIVVLSPIVLSVSLGHRGADPPQGWYLYDFGLMKGCRQLLVLDLPGWTESFGVNQEIYAAAFASIPVEHYQWQDIRPKLDDGTITDLESYSVAIDHAGRPAR